MKREAFSSFDPFAHSCKLEREAGRIFNEKNANANHGSQVSEGWDSTEMWRRHLQAIRTPHTFLPNRC